MTFEMIELQVTDLETIELTAPIVGNQILLKGMYIDGWPDVIVIEGARFQFQGKELLPGLSVGHYAPE